ncbi:MAG: hypothetical protein OXE57_15020 [Alphaproteobacteria bacterium]|nr:hypothetical protein [Alphaproteobacteria bacterium]
MPLPHHIRLDPERPFTTVWTEFDPGIPDYIDPPEDIRTYATREECLSDLQRWRHNQRRIDYETEDEESYQDTNCELIKYNSTYTFEVYDHERLRLAIQLQPDSEPVFFGPWAESPRPLDDDTPAFPSSPDRQQHDGDEPEPGPGARAGIQWIRERKPPAYASRLMEIIEDDELVPPRVGIAILETFAENCERACPAPDKVHLIDFDRIFRRAVECWFRHMHDTPERTWEKIKADYRRMYEAAGGDFNLIPGQDGFDALHRLVRQTLGAAHFPDRQEIRLRALAQTVETLASRRSTARSPAITSESIKP